jgi:hypothetical protein
MGRRIVIILVAFCAILCVAVLIIGIIGFREESEFKARAAVDHHAIGFISDRGAFEIAFSEGWPSPEWLESKSVRALSRMRIRAWNAIAIEGIVEQVTLTDGNRTTTITIHSFLTNMIYAGAFTALPPIFFCLLVVKRRPKDRIAADAFGAFEMRRLP